MTYSCQSSYTNTYPDSLVSMSLKYLIACSTKNDKVKKKFIVHSNEMILTFFPHLSPHLPL